jgi:hypothetical protein
MPISRFSALIDHLYRICQKMGPDELESVKKISPIKIERNETQKKKKAWIKNVGIIVRQINDVIRAIQFPNLNVTIY